MSSGLPSIADFERAGVSRSQLAAFLKQNGAGGQLTTVKKTVHRDGKTFQQTFHVAQAKQQSKQESPLPGQYQPKKRKPKVVATAATKPQPPPAAASITPSKPVVAVEAPKTAPTAAVKKTRSKKMSVDESIERAGGDPKATKKYVDRWVEHAGNESSISLRAAWANTAGVKMDEARLQRLYAHASRRPEGEIAGAVKSLVQHGDAPTVVSAARAITHLSQESYAGQSHVDVFRGVAGPQVKAIKDAIARGDKTVKIAVDNAASFTDDKRIATQFARGTGGSYKGTDTSHGGAVIRLKAPVTSILASHRAFPQQFDKKEKEVVIASHGVIEIPVADIELH